MMCLAVSLGRSRAHESLARTHELVQGAFPLRKERSERAAYISEIGFEAGIQGPPVGPWKSVK